MAMVRGKGLQWGLPLGICKKTIKNGDQGIYFQVEGYRGLVCIDEECLKDGFGYTPQSLHSWLTRVMYNRRSQFNPLWNTYIVAGLEEGQPYLGYVDKIGMAYEAPSLASGFGAYMALPLIRDAMEKKPDMTKDEAVALIDRCMKVLFYRDARSLNKYQYAVITKDGVDLQGPVVSETNWSVAHQVKGYE